MIIKRDGNVINIVLDDDELITADFIDSLGSTFMVDSIKTIFNARKRQQETSLKAQVLADSSRDDLLQMLETRTSGVIGNGRLG